MELFIEGKKCIKVVTADGMDMIEENGNVAYVSESGKLLVLVLVTIMSWNSLSAHVVRSPSVQSFKAGSQN